jgi:hypothetical protein
MTGPDDHHRRSRISALTAIAAALDDPARLVHAVQGAADDEDAVRRISGAFDVDEWQAHALMDLQFGVLTPAHRSRVTAELALLRAAWGAPLEGELELTRRRRALLSVDGTERRFTAGGLPGLLDSVAAFLRSEIAAPRLRPVVLTVTGELAGPVGMTVLPDGSASLDYEDTDS